MTYLLLIPTICIGGQMALFLTVVLVHKLCGVPMSELILLLRACEPLARPVRQDPHRR